MKKDAVQVQIRCIHPYLSNNGMAIFLGNKEKVFIIAVDTHMARVIEEFRADVPKQRPMTHDLLVSFMKGFGVTVERVVITDLRESTFHAKLVLLQQNELGRKIVEIDARPSDSIALAAAQKRPIYVARDLFDRMEDVSETLDRIAEAGDSAGTKFEAGEP
ncbi:MAG: bifunctional nuclease family protein [Verrucomicrobia bacterium]|nr:bifunctional nuclease family protein [Verrucomicrobiota bacterium]